MSVKAILFGSIGTLVDTSEIQRAAFNKAFKDAGLDWKWDLETYRSLLRNSGGQKRIQNFAEQRGDTVDAQELHRAKTQNFKNAIGEQRLEPREGVIQVVRHAYEHDIALGFVTSTSHDNIDITFEALGNTITADDFNFIGNGEMVTNGKPAADIYEKALKELELDSSHAIAIEDTAVSLMSAVNAGIQTIAFPGQNNLQDDFSQAALVTEVLHPDQFQTLTASERSSTAQDFALEDQIAS